MKVSIIICAYNEENTISKVVGQVLSLKLDFKKEIIVVNDGSTDNTLRAIENEQKKNYLKIINNEKNLGKGMSIRNALKESTGEIILIQDADLEYNPKEIPKILKPFQNPDVNVVYGSRMLKKNPVSHWTFNLGGNLLTFVANTLYGTKITDEATGYKAFRSKVIKKINLKSKGFEFCPEVTAKVTKIGFEIYEVPISYSPRPINEKKIKWWDGVIAIFYLFKYRFFD